MIIYSILFYMPNLCASTRFIVLFFFQRLLICATQEIAGWQSGHAADCNSVYAGSIPTSASNLVQCPSGEIGRHRGFKIPRPQSVPVRVWPRAPF